MSRPVVFIILGVGIVVAVGVMVVRRIQQAPETIAHGAVAESKATSIGVDELMKNVDEHRGDVIVQGIVSAAAPGRLSLIDVGEVEKCGVTTCAELTLPVEWSGTPPAVKQRLRLRGKVREGDGKLVFAAEQLELVELAKNAP